MSKSKVLLNVVRGLGFMLLIMLSTSLDTFGQKISTSPTRINFKVAPGASARGRITVTNSSNELQGFQVNFGDFKATLQGKSEFVAKGEVSRSCADWLSATPSVFQLGPGESQDVTVLMDVPADSSALKARWAVAYVRLAPPELEGKDGETLTVRVNQSYRFGVYVFQTPPMVTESKGEILSLDFTENLFTIGMKNAGETFLRCNSYIELTSLSNGQTERISTKGFTMLPAGVRNTIFSIPDRIKPGRYSVLAVMDYGNREEVEAAEMEILIPQKGNQH